ncbi:hypothetical protein [Streptomyces sp. NPDC085937]|uniref:hypothetical protein n=1 Tax=Streptomyces sp. NPDC085937 TaxID=3365742 RepID=UPI0037D69CA6
MRSFRLASATAAVALVLFLPYEAMPQARVQPREAAPEEPFGAACRVRIDGSRVTAHCHNPYPGTDRVALHVECARWWDLDGDGSPVAVGPARRVLLTGRCWSDVDAAWVSHARER